MPTTHGTLVANTATKVPGTVDVDEVGVLHKGNTADPIYVTAGTNAGVATATVAGADTFTVLPGQKRWFPLPAQTAVPAVSLISVSASGYEVEWPTP